MNDSDLKRLRAAWYRILREEGFRDIESIGGLLDPCPGAPPTGSHDAVARWNDRAATQRYYELALRFIHTRRYVDLPRQRQRVWSLHALGYSTREIAAATRLGRKSVRVTIATCRRWARLPESDVASGWRARDRKAA